MENPKASSSSDLWLMKEMDKYNPVVSSEGTYLADLPLGGLFKLSGRVFLKDSVKRTRALCIELETNKKFYVNLMARVKVS